MNDGTMTLETSPAEARVQSASAEGAASSPAACGCGNASSSSSSSSELSYVYALGSVESRFPNASVEKEFAQAGGRIDTAGKTAQEVLHAVISKRENRYLVRELCWVLRVQNLETYFLQPRDPADFDLLVEAIRPRPSPFDIDAVIGVRGPVAPGNYCNGLTIPVVRFDQIYSFDAPTLLKAIPRPAGMEKGNFDAVSSEVYTRIMQIADNAGATDEHRALNYLAMRYPAIYTKAFEQSANDFSLVAVEARRPSGLSGLHNVIDVIFTYSNRKTDFTEKFSVRVQMGKFPSLVGKLAPYFDR